MISMDFCYTSRPGTAEAPYEADDPADSEKNKLVVLVLHDKRTKFVEALPVQQKGAQKWLRYMCGEICRFASMLGYKQVTLRSDNEPTLYKLRLLGEDLNQDVQRRTSLLCRMTTQLTVQLNRPFNLSGNKLSCKSISVRTVPESRYQPCTHCIAGRGVMHRGCSIVSIALQVSQRMNVLSIVHTQVRLCNSENQFLEEFASRCAGNPDL